MKKGHGRATGWGACLILTLLIPVVTPGISLGGVVGSRHDFSSTAIGNQGACAPCHLPHKAQASLIWARNLNDEITYFTPNSNPNYVPGRTLLCYDCHDDMVTVTNPDPPSSNWLPGDRKPQDIAFSTTAVDVLRWNTTVGYYELIDGTSPKTGTPPKSTDPLPMSPTGGHYWKTEPTGAPVDYQKGDKIACSMCHDPHRVLTGSNDAFFRTSTPDGNGGTPIDLGNGRKASPNSRYFQLGGTGREMCAACHRYSDSTGLEAIPVRIWGVDLPKSPAPLAEHLTANATPCTNCHKHNKITVRCDDCHGYPPTTATPWSATNRTGESYTGGAGKHLSHFKGSGKTASDPDKYAFGCLGGTCHPANSHNTGAGVVARANVQVVFDAAWNPNGVFTAGGTPSLDACTQLYCHSNGLVENGANAADNGTGQAGVSGRGEWAEISGKTTFYGTTPAKPATWGGSLDCKGCHGKGDPNVLKEVAAGSSSVAVSAPDYLNAGSSPVDADGFNTVGANSHFIHVYKLPNNGGGTCRCHGTMDPAVIPATGHVNRTIEITDCASSCHLGGNWGDKHGTTPGADNCTNNTLMGCHGKERTYDSPGGRITRPANFAFPQDNQPKYMQSGHGLATTSFYSSGNPGAGLGCEACHLATDRLATNGPLEASYHYERAPLATGNPTAALSTNPYWLKAPYASNPDGLCRDCHDGTPAIDAKNHTAQGMIDPPANYNPYYDTVTVGTWSTFKPNCISCHDPHGEPNWYMLYDGDAEKSVSSYSLSMEYSGPVIYKGSRFGVTRAQSDQYGFPPDADPGPGVNYQGNQTAVVMTGKSLGSDFVNGTNTGICQVCHTLTKYFRNAVSQPNPGGAHISTLCLDCHKHATAFAPTGCEICHGNPPNAGCDLLQGTADDAPNVMGNGTNSTNLVAGEKYFDNGTYGYNVNGHGADGAATNNPPGLNPNLACTACHDLGSPAPSTHFDCSTTLNERVNTRSYFGKPADTRNANTAHLVSGFLAGANDPQAKQIGFDDYCYNTCHPAGGAIDMRHSYLDGNPTADEIMQFNITVTPTVTSDPKQDRGADNVWTPWTIDDLTNVVGVDANPPGTPRHHGVCVSCHNPHGTSTLQKIRGTNKMILRNWQDTAMPAFCTSNCHKIP